MLLYIYIKFIDCIYLCHPTILYSSQLTPVKLLTHSLDSLTHTSHPFFHPITSLTHSLTLIIPLTDSLPPVTLVLPGVLPSSSVTHSFTH